MGELIRRELRRAFEGALAGESSLRLIAQHFGDAGFASVPGDFGHRRPLVEAYYAQLDFRKKKDADKFYLALAAFLRHLESSGQGLDYDRVILVLQQLERDGLFYESGSIIPKLPTGVGMLGALAVQFDLQQMRTAISRIEASIEQDPGLAIGTAKELLETTCKTILVEMEVAHNEKDDLAPLLKQVLKTLQLDRESIPDAAKGARAMKTLSSNLASVSARVTELRNLYGTGHGRAGKTSGVTSRHARLAVGSATALAYFLMETYLERAAT